MTTITPLPTPVPSRTDPTNFSVRADAFLGALPTFVTETNAVASEVNSTAASVNSAVTALNNFPSQTGNYSKGLKTDGISLFWSDDGQVGDIRFFSIPPDSSKWIPCNGLYYSISTWSNLFNFLNTSSKPASTIYQMVQSSSGNGVTLYIGKWNRNVVMATSNGRLWTFDAIGTPIKSLFVFTSPSNFFAANNDTICVSVGNNNQVRVSTLSTLSGYADYGVFASGEVCRKIVYGNNLFFILTVSGKLYSSSNGESWTLVRSDLSGYDVLKSFSTSTIIAGNSNIYITEDGTTWYSFNLGSNILDVALYSLHSNIGKGYAISTSLGIRFISLFGGTIRDHGYMDDFGTPLTIDAVGLSGLICSKTPGNSFNITNLSSKENLSIDIGGNKYLINKPIIGVVDFRPWNFIATQDGLYTSLQYMVGTGFNVPLILNQIDGPKYAYIRGAV